MKSSSLVFRQLVIEILFSSMFLILGISALHAQDSVINIRLSYKVILNPANGNRPANATDVNINRAVRGMNTLLRSYWRGYRMQLTEIVEIGGLGDTSGPGKWYNTDLGTTSKINMERDAENDPVAYAWRDNDINIYINAGQGGGICSFPPLNPGNDEEIIIIGAVAVIDSSTHLHEIGHFFNLCHTHGCCRIPGECNDNNPHPDEVDDTIPDYSSWSLNDIAMHSFSKLYKDLDSGEKQMVDDVADNVMSYHHLSPLFNPLRRLTEGQLDRWTDATVLYSSRIDVRDGRAIYVASNGGTILNSTGYSNSPFSLFWGIFRASQSGSDVLILRPGAYNTKQTINKPLTLRATRQGAASIGISSGSTMAASE